MKQKKKTRFWTKTPALVGANIFALALLSAAPAMNVGKAAEEPRSSPVAQTSAIQPQAYEGMITDTRCEARHSASIGMAPGDCTRVCVHGGENFALVHGDAVYVLEGEPAALKHAAGQRVRIVGTLNGNKISVESVTAL
jgi:hypothetical protein